MSPIASKFFAMPYPSPGGNFRRPDAITDADLWGADDPSAWARGFTDAAATAARATPARAARPQAAALPTDWANFDVNGLIPAQAAPPAAAPAQRGRRFTPQEFAPPAAAWSPFETTQAQPAGPTQQQAQPAVAAGANTSVAPNMNDPRQATRYARQPAAPSYQQRQPRYGAGNREFGRAQAYASPRNTRGFY